MQNRRLTFRPIPFQHQLLGLLLVCVTASTTAQPAVVWPTFGPAAAPDAPGLTLNAHTNALPDFVGPVDGSARLTIFTEGNHFPVLLPLIYDQFVPHSQQQGGGCAITADEILVVTLPQVMIVEALSGGGGRITFGNAVLPLDPAPGRVYPDWIMGGKRPLTRLADAGIVEPTAVPFARHNGLGILLRRDHADGIDTLADLAAADHRLVIATPYEAGARRQYLKTLDVLIGHESAANLMARDIKTFPGRIRIQHRDVPFALLTDQADAGLIFGHLARFYADAYPDQLAFRPVPGAAPFGQEILLARPTAADDRDPAVDCFRDFLLDHAATAYPAGGFADPTAFGFGQTIRLQTDP
ncbi:MAG: substrate-binding domain-containing protein [Planctomycetota bacterium]